MAPIEDPLESVRQDLRLKLGELTAARDRRQRDLKQIEAQVHEYDRAIGSMRQVLFGSGFNVKEPSAAVHDEQSPDYMIRERQNLIRDFSVQLLREVYPKPLSSTELWTRLNGEWEKRFPTAPKIQLRSISKSCQSNPAIIGGADAYYYVPSETEDKVNGLTVNAAQQMLQWEKEHHEEPSEVAAGEEPTSDEAAGEEAAGEEAAGEEAAGEEAAAPKGKSKA